MTQQQNKDHLPVIAFWACVAFLIGCATVVDIVDAYLDHQINIQSIEDFED